MGNLLRELEDLKPDDIVRVAGWVLDLCRRVEAVEEALGLKKASKSADKPVPVEETPKSD